MEWIFAKHGTQLVVLGSDIDASSSEAEDLFSITTVFVARHNGLRSATNRKKRQEVAKEAQDLQEDDDRRETSSRQSTTHPPFSHPRRTAEVQGMDGGDAVDL